MKKQPVKQPPNERNKDGLMFRATSVETVYEEGKEPVVRMSVSSEVPVLTWVYFGESWIRAYEILDHAETSVDRSRMQDGLVIQDTHYGDQVGLIRSPMIMDKKIGGDVEFCSGDRAQEIGADAVKGLRRNTSVGYTVDATSYRLEGEKDGYPVVRAMRWTPYEASFVNVPADTSVGVGRELNQDKSEHTGDNERNKTMTPKQMAELAKRANENGVGDKLAGIIEANETFEAAERALNDAIITSQREQIQVLSKPKKEDPCAGNRIITPIGGDLNDEKKIMRNYSLLNVCRALSGENVDIGLEREVSQECRKHSRHEDKGIIIPFCALAKRDFTVSGTSSATVETMLYAQEFIDVLREKYLLGLLGVQFMPGMIGNVSIPEMTAGTTCYHVAEGGEITESQPTLGNKTGTPHTIGTLVDITRRMMAQSTPNAENMVRDEITKRIMLGVQADVFAGTGADGQPSAITTATGINNPSVTQGTPTYAEILNFIGSIISDNAEKDGQKWAMTGEVMVKLGSTMRNATYGEIPILDPEKPTMLGKPWFTSEGLPANSLWFGDWTSIVIPMWGAGVEVAADTSKLFASGGLTLRALLDFDVVVRQGKALAYNTAVTS